MINRVVKKLSQKSRLYIYRNILEKARNEGYIVTSLTDWYENNFYEGKKVFISRHDVDMDPEGAFKMFLIEKELGVKSTFYFRWMTVHEKYMRLIHEYGSEVSLHYETLATLCKQKGLKKNNVDQSILDQAGDILRNEIKVFENRFWEIKTLCSHGDTWNQQSGIPNHEILKNISRKELGIYFETYDEEIISKFDCYISDGSAIEDHKWRYGTSPEEAITNGATQICLLTHPVHWNYHLIKNIRTLFKYYREEQLIQKRSYENWNAPGQ